VAGTNFVFQPAQLEALKKRFTVEDFTENYGRKAESKPENSTGAKTESSPKKEN
jgi:hypothetical protein